MRQLLEKTTDNPGRAKDALADAVIDCWVVHGATFVAGGRGVENTSGGQSVQTGQSRSARSGARSVGRSVGGSDAGADAGAGVDMDSDTDTDTVAWEEEGDVEEYGEAEVEACFLSMDVLGLMLSTCSQRGKVRRRVYQTQFTFSVQGRTQW